MQPPKLTFDVSILAYQSAATSPAALGSVLDAVLGADSRQVQAVVVREQAGDQAEHDALSTLAAGHPRVLVEAGDNLGYAGGHNRAFSRTKADVFVVVNADAEIEPGFFDALGRAFADPSVGSVQPLVLRPGRSSIDTAGLQLHRSRQVTNRGAGRPVSEAPDEGDVWGADGAVAAYRRIALDDAGRGAGPWDESFVAYKEDVDLAWRLRRLGWRCRFVPQAGAVHHRSARDDAESGEATPLQRLRARRALPDVANQRGFVNHRLAQVKNERPSELARDAVPFLAREIAAWAVMAAGPGSCRAAAAEIARRLPEAVRARSATPTRAPEKSTRVT